MIGVGEQEILGERVVQDALHGEKIALAASAIERSLLIRECRVICARAEPRGVGARRGALRARELFGFLRVAAVIETGERDIEAARVQHVGGRSAHEHRHRVTVQNGTYAGLAEICLYQRSDAAPIRAGPFECNLDRERLAAFVASPVPQAPAGRIEIAGGRSAIERRRRNRRIEGPEHRRIFGRIGRVQTEQRVAKNSGTIDRFRERSTHERIVRGRMLRLERHEVFAVHRGGDDVDTGKMHGADGRLAFDVGDVNLARSKRKQPRRIIRIDLEHERSQARFTPSVPVRREHDLRAAIPSHDAERSGAVWRLIPRSAGDRIRIAAKSMRRKNPVGEVRLSKELRGRCGPRPSQPDDDGMRIRSGDALNSAIGIR